MWIWGGWGEVRWWWREGCLLSKEGKGKVKGAAIIACRKINPKMIEGMYILTLQCRFLGRTARSHKGTDSNRAVY